MHSPWASIKLNDGRYIPGIAFGSAYHAEEAMPDIIAEAIKAGFRHVDTAQNYGNETGVGKGITQSGLPREAIWVTTKWSGLAPIARSIDESLERLGVGDIEENWMEMEKVWKEGKAKPIGLSNYSLEDLRRTLAVCTIKPAVNQIWLSPNNYATNLPLLEYMAEQGILAEAYSPLWPLTSGKCPNLMEVIERVAGDKGVAVEQVLLAWSRAKGLLPVTSTSKVERAAKYMSAGDIMLSDGEVRRIDEAGACYWE